MEQSPSIPHATLLQTVSGFADTKLPADWVQLHRDTGQIRPGTLKDSKVFLRRFSRLLARGARPRSVSGKRAPLPTSIRRCRGFRPRGRRITNSRPLFQRQVNRWSIMNRWKCCRVWLRLEGPIDVQAELNPHYSNGVWADKDSYHLQNWAWFGTALYRGYLGPSNCVRSR